jgi:hypothetical protein
VNETINPPRHRPRTVAAAQGPSFSQQGCTANETFVHAVDGWMKVGPGRPGSQSTLLVGILRFDVCTQQVLGRTLVANPLVIGALVDELVDSEAVEGDRLHLLMAAVASSGDHRPWDDRASPLPRLSAAPCPRLAALAS